MTNVRELYQQVILDHYKSPRNYKKLEVANRHSEGHNPLCGDEVAVYVQLEDGVIKDISFEGSGCAISKASASMMTAALKGKSAAESESLFDEFHRMITGKLNPESDPHHLGKLAIFSGVREFPVRVKCASLAWHTLRSALEGRDDKVTTEAGDAA